MTDQNEKPSNGQEMTINPLMEFWTKYIEESTEHAQTLMNSLQSGADLKTLRRVWLDGLATSMDSYMRSPVFLEAMKNNFKAMTQMHCTTEDWARDFTRATGMPRVSDISGLFERLQIGQDAIMNRLSAIEDKLEAQEGKRKKTNGSPDKREGK